MAREVRKSVGNLFEPAFAQMERKSRASLLSSSGLESVQPASYAIESQTVADVTESYQGETTTLASGMNLVTTMVGAGVLSFPGLFKMGGWFIAPLMLVISAASVIEIGLILCKSLEWSEQRARKYPTEYSFGIRPEKYEDLMEVAFGKVGKTLTFCAFNIFLVMVCGAYMILIGQSVEFIAGQSWLPYRVCVLIMALLFGPLTLLDNMVLISRLSGIGVIASITYVICIAWAGFSQSYSGSYSRPLGDSMRDIGTLISVMLMGFTYQIVVPTVRAEMAEPAEMPKAITGSVSVVAAIYMLAGAAGFFGYGLAVEGNVLKSMVTAEGKPIVPGILLSLSIVANLLVTIPILMNCVCRAVESRVGGYNVGVRIGLFLTALAVGFFCPYFFEFFAIVASLICVPICIFMPLAIYWRLQGGDNDEAQNDPARLLRVAKHSVVLILGLITFFVGTINNFKELGAALGKDTGDFWAHS